MPTVAELLLTLSALYPVITAALWVAGGVLYQLSEEREVEQPADGEWPAVTVLIPAYNEEEVIATSVAAVLASDYPGELELLVLDDGSTAGTEDAALSAASGDLRCRVLRDPVNRGKA